MDETNGMILEELMRDGKRTVKQIARKLALPMSTVHHRIKRLESDGTIARYAAIVDYKRMGLPISAFIQITVDYGEISSQEEVARQIKKIPNVDEVCMVTGEIDIIAKVRAAGIDELNDSVTHKLRAIRGIDKTKTLVVLKEIN